MIEQLKNLSHTILNNITLVMNITYTGAFVYNRAACAMRGNFDDNVRGRCLKNFGTILVSAPVVNFGWFEQKPVSSPRKWGSIYSDVLDSRFRGNDMYWTQTSTWYLFGYIQRTMAEHKGTIV